MNVTLENGKFLCFNFILQYYTYVRNFNVETEKTILQQRYHYNIKIYVYRRRRYSKATFTEAVLISDPYEIVDF